MSNQGAEGAGPAGEGTRRDGGRDGGRDDERRAGGVQRVHFEALVAVGEDAGGSFEAESVDVSPDGMRLRTAYLPAEGDKLVCRFDGMGSEIVAEGEVLWRREEAKGGEFGLRFVGLDDATAGALRAMCMTLGDPDGGEDAAASEPVVARGARVRLHIEGLGSPMKARVRDSSARELSVGSNLEFLKVGRALELEDVDQGKRREATIDDVKVDVDPATNVPQLVVTLRFERASAAADTKQDRPLASAAPATRRTLAAPSVRPPETKRASVPPKKKERVSGAPEETEADAASAAAAGFAARAQNAGRAVAERVGPALAGAGARARTAAAGVMAFYEKRRNARAETQKTAPMRRTTAPPPGGALTSDGRRLVRDEALSEDEISLPTKSPRRAAATGGALGLLVVLCIFGAARLMGRAHADAPAASAAADARTSLASLPPAPEPAAAPGTPTANVPLFGATPLSTTEPAPGAAPSALASAAPSSAPATPPGADPDEPSPDNGGRILKEWGQGPVTHPIVLKIKMDGPIEKINGAAGAMGFTISVPGRRSVSTGTDFTRKDKRLASVNVVNSSHGAEITVQFKDGVPPYLAKVKGDRLEIALGKEGHSKIAKKKKKHSKHADDDQ